MLVGLPRSADHRDVRNDGKSRKDYWTLTPDDHVLGKEPGELAWLRDRGRFPRAESEIDRDRVEELAWQLNLTDPNGGW